MWTAESEAEVNMAGINHEMIKICNNLISEGARVRELVCAFVCVAL